MKLGLAARIVWWFLWSKKGLDIRCRMLAVDSLLAKNPKADADETRAFVLGLLPLDLGYRLPATADLLSLAIAVGFLVVAPSWLVNAWLRKHSLGPEAVNLVALMLQWVSFYAAVSVLASLIVVAYAYYDYARRLRV